jgi:hypothetical protein
MLAIVLVGAMAGPLAQPAADKANITVDPSLLAGLEYRSLGFGRGGRSTAVAGVAGDQLTYYFGSTGGGVWKTRKRRAHLDQRVRRVRRGRRDWLDCRGRR